LVVPIGVDVHAVYQLVDAPDDVEVLELGAEVLNQGLHLWEVTIGAIACNQYLVSGQEGLGGDRGEATP
jgi:hypothetical protein